MQDVAVWRSRIGRLRKNDATVKGSLKTAKNYLENLGAGSFNKRTVHEKYCFARTAQNIP